MNINWAGNIYNVFNPWPNSQKFKHHYDYKTFRSLGVWITFANNFKLCVQTNFVIKSNCIILKRLNGWVTNYHFKCHFYQATDVSTFVTFTYNERYLFFYFLTFIIWLTFLFKWDIYILSVAIKLMTLALLWQKKMKCYFKKWKHEGKSYIYNVLHPCLIQSKDIIYHLKNMSSVCLNAWILDKIMVTTEFSHKIKKSDIIIFFINLLIINRFYFYIFHFIVFF